METFPETSPEKLPLNRGVRLLAHNEDGLVALEKPTGAMSHPNSSEDAKKSLLTAEYDYNEECYSWTDPEGKSARAWLINRLDSPTSGVILLGLNEEISRVIKAEFASHRITKLYYALVRGKPGKPQGVWEDRLKKDLKIGSRLIKQAQIVPAKARFQMVRSPTGGFPVTLMKLFPQTGRTHQLRVQCKKHGLPIVGDRTYGSFSFNREVKTLTGEKRMMLHSAQTIVNYSYKGKLREFSAESELPEAFRTVMSYRPGMNPGKPSSGKRSSLDGRRFRQT